MSVELHEHNDASEHAEVIQVDTQDTQKEGPHSLAIHLNTLAIAYSHLSTHSAQPHPHRRIHTRTHTHTTLNCTFTHKYTLESIYVGTSDSSKQ